MYIYISEDGGKKGQSRATTFAVVPAAKNHQFYYNQYRGQYFNKPLLPYTFRVLVRYCVCLVARSTKK